MVKYVGRTKNSLKTRFYGHYSSTKNNTKKSAWIKKLRSLKLKPIIEIIEEKCYNDTYDGWLDSYNNEKYWIQQFQYWGFILLNHIDKGAGFKNRCWYNHQYDIMNKPVNQYDLQGNYIQSFKSCKIASDKLNINYKIIQGCASKN